LGILVVVVDAGSVSPKKISDSADVVYVNTGWQVDNIPEDFLCNGIFSPMVKPSLIVFGYRSIVSGKNSPETIYIGQGVLILSGFNFAIVAAVRAARQNYLGGRQGGLPRMRRKINTPCHYHNFQCLPNSSGYRSENLLNQICLKIKWVKKCITK